MMTYWEGCWPLRLACWAIMNGDPTGFFCLFAVVCTSFSAINVGTSRRTPSTPMGDTTKKYVRDTWLVFTSVLGVLIKPQWSIIGIHVVKISEKHWKTNAKDANTMVSRCLLLAYLAVCLGGCFMIEQPASSRLPWYPKFEEFSMRVKLWRVGWWSRHYGALSPILAFFLLINALLFLT